MDERERAKAIKQAERLNRRNPHAFVTVDGHGNFVAAFTPDEAGLADNVADWAWTHGLRTRAMPAAAPPAE